MGFYLKDELRDPIAICSATAWGNMADWVEENYPTTELAHFIATGISEKPEEFLESIELMEPHASKDIRSVFRSIKRFMRANPLLIMLSDGTVA
jgi:hypothetical protein